MKDKYDYVIVGAGRAGVTAALTLRETVPSSTILILNGEDRLPYKRTNLTKHLSKPFGRDDFALLSEQEYQSLGLDRIDGDPVMHIDPDSQTLDCRSGLRFSWERLLLSTGAVPHCLDIPGAQWICHLRSIDEAEDIGTLLKLRPRTVVIGQGVEGVELAEQCRLAGCEVLIMGRESRMMARWFDPVLSRMMEDLLEEKGIDCRYSLLPRSVVCEDSSFVLECGDQRIEADLILSSLGVRGNPHLAKDLGLYGETGILTDRHCRSSSSRIFAAGDVVQSDPGWPRGLWHWAEYQGKTAALNMAASMGDGHPDEAPELFNRLTRLKCEPFGDFFFSMAYDAGGDYDGDRVYMKSDKRYLRIFEREGKSVAALMRGWGKAGGKALEKAVRNGSPAAEIAEELEPLQE